MYLKQRRKPSRCKSVSEPQLTAPLKLHCKSWICYELKMVNSLHHWSVHGLSSDLMVSTLYLLQWFRPWPVSFSLQRKLGCPIVNFLVELMVLSITLLIGKWSFVGNVFEEIHFTEGRPVRMISWIVRVYPKSKPENYSFPTMLLLAHEYNGS